MVTYDSIGESKECPHSDSSPHSDDARQTGRRCVQGMASAHASVVLQHLRPLPHTPMNFHDAEWRHPSTYQGGWVTGDRGFLWWIIEPTIYQFYSQRPPFKLWSAQVMMAANKQSGPWLKWLLYGPQYARPRPVLRGLRFGCRRRNPVRGRNREGRYK